MGWGGVVMEYRNARENAAMGHMLKRDSSIKQVL